MQSSTNNAESGGLNFVFESGSSGRENKKYVRSHAAKVGWSQRSRNRAAPRDAAVNPDTPPPRKRRKTHTDPIPGGPSSAEQPIIYSPVTHPTEYRNPSEYRNPTGYRNPTEYRHVQDCTAEAGPSAYPGSSSSLAAHVSPQQDVSNQDAHFGAYPAIHHPTFAAQGPAYTSVAYPPSSPLHQCQREAQPGHVRVPEVGASPSNRAATGAAPIYSFDQGHHPSRYGRRPGLIQYDSVAQQSMVPRFRPAASLESMQPRHVMQGAEIFCPVLRTGQLPSPQLPPLTNTQTPQALSLGANWRQQYDNTQVMNIDAPQPSAPTRNTPGRHDESNRALTKPSRSPSPKRTAPPAFLELVMNEDHPMWKPVDSGNDSFKVFPVKWQPFYGRLLQNYRSNMLVQLDEILTGWSVKDKLEFNQMPLRLAGSEPSLFYSLLATAAIMMPPGLISPTIPKWLQTRTVECLNQAFSDPNRAYSDATILAVNMVALFESTSGHASLAASTHQPSLRKMVEKRGGLKTLSSATTTTTTNENTPNADSVNLVRFLAWTDRVIECQTGNPLIFGDFEEEDSVKNTDWDGIWARMERRVEENMPVPIEELPDE